ncbi:MAG: peptide transporter [Planctomycetota bacterium]|nr:MAG: peptide transporter [Planctomycetota bacterium]
MSKEDKELAIYRDLMKVPDKFEDGFGGKTIVGALFLGLFMMPGSLYLQLVVGEGMGPAARWVTIILFAEIARRSLQELRQQEIYILYYMTGLSIASPFFGLLWNQYLVQSDPAIAMGVAQEIPAWVAPSAKQMEEAGRTFFHPIWYAPIALMVTTMVIHRIDHFGLGYFLYRLTSDVEELPFPMAPVAAQGCIALTESKDPADQWRWTCFTTGAMLGGGFGLIYVGLPAISSILLSQEISLLPIPFKDFTTSTENIFPATAINLSCDLTLVVLGMVLPFWAVIGGVVGFLITLALNPALLNAGILHTWRPGMGVVDTMFSNNIDFYLSFGIGVTLSIAAVSFGAMLKPLMRRGKPSAQGGFKAGFKKLLTNNTMRGDISIWISLCIYFGATASYILICIYLIEGFPWFFFLAYAFIYTPLISYANAKLEGLAGQTVSIPLIREASFIMSGYKGVAIWFAPIPLYEYGRVTMEFRVVELTGTKLSSVIKTELVVLPIVITSFIVFSHFIWQMAPVPSDSFKFTKELWPLYAKNMSLTYSSTLEGSSPFLEALKGAYIAYGFFGGVGLFILLTVLGLPTLLVYGVVRGLGQGTPHAVVPELIGALAGRYYFHKKFGDKWRKYTPVLLAGFSCGIGLIGMGAIGFKLLSSAISALPF